MVGGCHQVSWLYKSADNMIPYFLRKKMRENIRKVREGIVIYTFSSIILIWILLFIANLFGIVVQNSCLLIPLVLYLSIIFNYNINLGIIIKLYIHLDFWIDSLMIIAINISIMIFMIGTLLFILTLFIRKKV